MCYILYCITKYKQYRKTRLFRLLLTGTNAGKAALTEKLGLQQAAGCWPLRDLLLKEPLVGLETNT